MTNWWYSVMNIVHGLVGLSSLKNVVIFAAGVGCTMLYYRWKDQRDDVKDPDGVPHKTEFRQLWIYAGLALAVTFFIAVRTQISADRADRALAAADRNASQAKETAQHNRECFNHLADVMRQRGNLSDTIDPALQSQVDNLGQWLHDLGAPPPNIASLHTTDQRYQDWVAVLNERYSKILEDARDQQKALIADRRNHPIPDPSCG